MPSEYRIYRCKLSDILDKIEKNVSERLAFRRRSSAYFSGKMSGNIIGVVSGFYSLFRLFRRARYNGRVFFYFIRQYYFAISVIMMLTGSFLIRKNVGEIDL
jgi:Flp pilus assembly protein TadB